MAPPQSWTTSDTGSVEAEAVDELAEVGDPAGQRVRVLRGRRLLRPAHADVVGRDRAQAERRQGREQRAVVEAPGRVAVHEQHRRAGALVDVGHAVAADEGAARGVRPAGEVRREAPPSPGDLGGRGVDAAADAEQHDLVAGGDGAVLHRLGQHGRHAGRADVAELRVDEREAVDLEAEGVADGLGVGLADLVDDVGVVRPAGPSRRRRAPPSRSARRARGRRAAGPWCRCASRAPRRCRGWRAACRRGSARRGSACRRSRDPARDSTIATEPEPSVSVANCSRNIVSSQRVGGQAVDRRLHREAAGLAVRRRCRARSGRSRSCWRRRSCR